MYSTKDMKGYSHVWQLGLRNIRYQYGRQWCVLPRRITHKVYFHKSFMISWSLLMEKKNNWSINIWYNTNYHYTCHLWILLRKCDLVLFSPEHVKGKKYKLGFRYWNARWMLYWNKLVVLYCYLSGNTGRIMIGVSSTAKEELIHA